MQAEAEFSHDTQESSDGAVQIAERCGDAVPADFSSSTADVCRYGSVGDRTSSILDTRNRSKQKTLHSQHWMMSRDEWSPMFGNAFRSLTGPSLVSIHLNQSLVSEPRRGFHSTESMAAKGKKVSALSLIAATPQV
jgi:hypothetical protein